MIVVVTETPDELANCLKSYFLIQGRYDIIETPIVEEDILESWDEETEPFNDKLSFILPKLILTNKEELIDFLQNDYIFAIFREIDDINNASKTFIQCGFLPLDHELIRHYVSTFINPSENPILTIFHRLGYISDTNEPTDKLISSLINSDIEDISKYGNLLIIARNNNAPTNNQKYKDFLYECLKYVDFNIFAALSTNTKTN